MRYEFATCVLDTESHTLTRGGNLQAVEPQVFDLLLLLVENAGNLVTRDAIIARVWGGRIVSESAVSARITAARKAVGDDGKRQAIIRTVARRGLQFVAEVSVGPPDQPKRAPKASADALRIRYATATDGAKLAYSVHGSGPPLLRTIYFPHHLELNWREPFERSLIDMLSENNTLIRYDERGTGLSDLELPEFNLEQSADDMLAVVDTLGLDKVAIHGVSSGAMNAVQFAANYPDRVSKLVLEAGYVDGRVRRHQGTDGAAHEPILSMVREGWDQPGHAFIMAYVLMYFPQAPMELIEGTGRIIQESTSAKNAALVRDGCNQMSIAPLLEHVKAPTLVVHSRGDNVHPVSEARKMAGGIPGAELLVLETANAMILPFDPCWEEYCAAIREFLNRD